MQSWRQEGMYTLQKEMRKGIFDVNNDALNVAFMDNTIKINASYHLII